ncbi:MAG: TspO/MBR family protein [Microcoleaceae cyanobacterium]
MIPSWLVIGGVVVLIAGAGNAVLNSEDMRWFNRLQRPQWLTFEKLIPAIWITTFIAAAWSAYIVWENEPNTLRTWLLMGVYFLLEVVTIAYTPVMCKSRSLRAGTILGGTGVLISLLLILSVWPMSQWAALLLMPYAIWSPIGTYTTGSMIPLNPADA